jgi:hypothetical protein
MQPGIDAAGCPALADLPGHGLSRWLRGSDPRALGRCRAAFHHRTRPESLSGDDVRSQLLSQGGKNA